ncbi:hypothetical protein E2C01_079858 [Portunus trituberculatus]|uniref:Uncharacterized protein n=1 Tax=Portunus trituberculatus TaxID=210409 RepID=A0A5B7ISF2_PORTR|nr:hypothetical protein [Portunus trituberculatus]
MDHQRSREPQQCPGTPQPTTHIHSKAPHLTLFTRSAPDCSPRDTSTTLVAVPGILARRDAHLHAVTWACLYSHDKGDALKASQIRGLRLQASNSFEFGRKALLP